MFLRRYHTSDCEYLAELFYQTVHNKLRLCDGDFSLAGGKSHASVT